MAVQPCVLIIKRLTKSGGKPQVQYHLWAHALDCNYFTGKNGYKRKGIGKMDAYKEFAYVYDELMDTTPYEEWSSIIIEEIEKYGVSKPVRAMAGEDAQTVAAVLEAEDAELFGDMSLAADTEDGVDHEKMEEEILASERDLVVDLGCGTGNLTELLYRAGYDMIGVDNSDEMLNVAMEKRQESGSEILYLNQDMRELELYSTVGTVVSVCDSLNYILEEEELFQVFSLINNYLYPGGLFLFDFNTVYKYEQVIGDTTIAENREDCSFIWENFYDPEEELNEYDITLFIQQESGDFRKCTETHFQRGYRPEQIRKLLEKAGLEIVEMKDSDTCEAVTQTTQRVFTVAREHLKKAVK